MSSKDGKYRITIYCHPNEVEVIGYFIGKVYDGLFVKINPQIHRSSIGVSLLSEESLAADLEQAYIALINSGH